MINSSNVVEEDSTRIINLLCSGQAGELDALLSRIEQSVKTLAVYASTHLESAERLKNDPTYVNEHTKSVEDVAVNAASNTEGAMAVYVRYNPEITPPTSGLFWSKTELDGSFRQLTPTDFSGYNPTDVEHVGWYYIPVKNGKPTWMKPYLNKNINVEMISYVIPVYVDNQTIGVVGMDIDFRVITDVVDKIQIYDTGYAFLTGDDGNIVRHKNSEPGMLLSGLDPTLKTISAEMQSSTSTIDMLDYSLNGQDMKLAYRTLRNGMRLSVTAPTIEIDSNKNNLIIQIGIALLLIVAISVALTISVTRHLVRPLKELNVAAQKIAAGEFTVSLTKQSKDEVGTLAESFLLTVEHLQKYISYINGLAYRDSLTGVKNKTAYLEVEKNMEEQMRSGRPEFAVVVLDINGLKKVNDTYGHDFGDMLIICACKIICNVFRHSPVYRIGGDEFVVILENNDYEHYQELLENLQIEIDKYNENSRTDSRVSVARGIALYESETDLVFANVFKRADDAMYQNKAAMKASELESV